MNFTDEMLQEAAKEMNQEMVKSLPDPEQCHHKFSKSFLRKMKRLTHDVEHPVLYRVLRRVACILVVLTLGFASLLAISPTVRAIVFGWIKEQYEAFTTYYFAESPSDMNNSVKYQIKALPKGYTEIAASEDPGYYLAIYANVNDEIVNFSYSSNLEDLKCFIKNDGYNIEEITIANEPADFYHAIDPMQSNCLIWYDKDASTAFFISGYMEKDMLITLAESVSKIK